METQPLTADQRYNANRAKRRREDPDYRAKMNDQWNANRHTPRGIFNTYRSNARRRGISFTLPAELVYDLISDNCYYCGAEPKPFNGIDRVDNSRGYDENNVVSCCTLCNYMKKTYTRDQFVEQCKRVAERWS